MLHLQTHIDHDEWPMLSRDYKSLPLPELLSMRPSPLCEVERQTDRHIIYTQNFFTCAGPEDRTFASVEGKSSIKAAVSVLEYDHLVGADPDRSYAM